MSNLKIETRLFINGEYTPAKDGKTFELLNPATGQHVADVSSAGKEDVDAAVEAAKAAWPEWSNRPAAERGALLRKLAELLKERRDELAQLESLSMGKPISFAKNDIDFCATFLNYYAGLANGVHGHTSLNVPGHLNYTLMQPYGVTAGICPFNFPLVMLVNKVGPSVAAGNAILLKPSEKSPLTAILLAAVAKEAGFPPGIINVLTGAGETGKLISEHMEIRKISFTGSTRTGRRIQASAAMSNLKSVTLELGGKSPLILFEDCDIEKAAASAAFSVLLNSGQVCMANTRVYVHSSIAPAVTEKLKHAFSQQVQGDPLDPLTTLGPQADSIQGKAVADFLAIGKKEGKVLIGGEVNSTQGANFIQPTIFTDVGDDAQISRDEIFGPVVVLHKFTDEADVIKRANDTEYGLYASIFTKDFDRALRVSKALEAGTVSLNCAAPTTSPDMPFGGWKGSGIGREFGPRGLEPWLETKTVVCAYN